MSDLRQISTEKIEALWQECIDDIGQIVDKPIFETVVKYIHPVAKDADTLELAMPMPWQKDHLMKYVDPITGILSGRIGRQINLSLIVKPNGASQTSGPEISFHEIPAAAPVSKEYQKVDDVKVESEIVLDPRYTFDNFVIGNSNRFAAAAAQAVGEAPAVAYNPLFIYGGVGLGKTHLIHAIGHMVKQKNPKSRVVYVSAEKFMNDMIESIQNKKMMEFRRKYRNVKVLLIDDIQFIKNKESTQEEFFHTFNELHGAKSQIVITSDRPPKDIPTLEDRLRSRFEGGLIADISTPDVETRMAILKKKTEMENLDVSNDVISYIAEKIPSNIRELEGALNRVICYASLLKQPISMDLALTALKTIIPDTRPRHLTIKFIQEKVCEYYNIKIDEMLGKSRDNRLVVPRQVAMHISKDMLGESFPNIGKSFGGRDHTTVMHACKKMAKLKKEPSMKIDLDNINNMLKSAGG